MMKRILWAALALMLAAAFAPTVNAATSLESLNQGDTFEDLRVESLYLDAMGEPMGARFRHTPTGFVLDLLRIQSVPQGFFWVNSFPPSDQGEPHTCEHLLLGKGTKGRYVGSLEAMSLGESSAFTMQLQTCYHFHTTAGSDAFLKLFEAKLDALLHPNYSDEEIRREVAHMGYAIDPADSSIRLEEKGTVYNEMLSGYERPWSNLSRKLDVMLYGKGHPLSNDAGGYPPAIRTMTPDDLRNFHRNNYHLGNMGVVVAIPDELSMDDVLTRISAILHRVQPEGELGADPALAEEHLPAPESAPEGTMAIATFPHQNAEEPGLLIYAWPPQLNLDNNDAYLLDLLIGNVASGQTSNLYRRFIDSRTREFDIGANAVFGWASDDLGHPIYIGLSNVKRETCEEATMGTVREMIQDEFRRIAAMEAGSDELAAFNERIRNRIIERRRGLRKFLNSPPGFGFRGSGAQWYEHLKHLQNVDGFRKQLTLDSELDYASALLDSGKNFWKEYIDRWHLLDTKPYAVAARPDPEMLAQSEKARANRIDKFIADLEDRFNVTTRDEAISRFKADYDKRTEAIEAEARKIPMPELVSNPPMTLDDQLHYEVDTLPEGEQLVTSTFDYMSGGTVGIVFDMYAVTPSDLLYVPAVPLLLTEVGVIRDGKPMAFDEMKEALRREVLNLNAYYDTNPRTERVELVLRGSGSDLQETQRALDWIESILYSPNWTAGNLDRIRDAVDMALRQRRNTMQRGEEAWVEGPAYAYWRQTNPLYLSASCFLTQTHALQRLRWQLRELPSAADREEFSSVLSLIGSMPDRLDRDGLRAMLTDITGGESDKTDTGWPRERFTAASEPAQEMIVEAAKDLSQCLGDIPDGSLGTDWKYLCDEIAADLAVPPADAVDQLSELMSRLRHRDNVRTFMIGSSKTQADLEPRLDRILDRLDSAPSMQHEFGSAPVIMSRLRARNPEATDPIFVGLMNPNTRSGVFVNMSDCVVYQDAKPETLLKFLTSRLYGGHGAHSMFMKTWGAGLAYSNGLRHYEEPGRMVYYAERCPDLAQTMQFVVDQLKSAPYDTSLASYAIAQAFAVSRAAGGYEQRGEAMASDLADGVTPEKVTAFRRGILALRDNDQLYDELHDRMEATYGEVLPGYGPKARDVPGAVYFVIGPEAQFESFEEYLKGAGEDAALYRLYPRDFWLTSNAQ